MQVANEDFFVSQLRAIAWGEMGWSEALSVLS